MENKLETTIAGLHRVHDIAKTLTLWQVPFSFSGWPQKSFEPSAASWFDVSSFFVNSSCRVLSIHLFTHISVLTCSFLYARF